MSFGWVNKIFLIYDESSPEEFFIWGNFSYQAKISSFFREGNIDEKSWVLMMFKIIVLS